MMSSCWSRVLLYDVVLHAAVPVWPRPSLYLQYQLAWPCGSFGCSAPSPRLQSFLRLLLYDSVSIQSVGPVHVQQACMVAWPSRLARMKTLSIPFVHTHCIGLGAPALSSGVHHYAGSHCAGHSNHTPNVCNGRVAICAGRIICCMPGGTCLGLCASLLCCMPVTQRTLAKRSKGGHSDSRHGELSFGQLWW